MVREQLKSLKVGDVIYSDTHSFYKITKLYSNGVQYRDTWKNTIGTFSQLKFVTNEELLMPYWRVMENDRN